MIIKGKNKKAVSPIIATVLLIALVLVGASIIFLWARAFIPEVVQKFESPVEDACKDVAFAASYNAGTLTIQNNGNVPIHTIRIGVKKEGSLEYQDVIFGPPVVAGATREFSTSGINSGDEVLVIPVLLGKTTNGELRAYACGDENAEIINA